VLEREKVTKVTLNQTAIIVRMYNLRARVRLAAVCSVRPPVEVRAQALPTATASQVIPTQALEILSKVSMVPETEVPFDSQLAEEAISPPILAYAPDMSFVSVRDTTVDLSQSMYILVPVAADSAAVQGPAVKATPTRPRKMLLCSMEELIKILRKLKR